MKLVLQSEQLNVECCSQKDEMVSKQHVFSYGCMMPFFLTFFVMDRELKWFLTSVCSHMDKYVTMMTKLCVTDRAVKLFFSHVCPHVFR